MTNWKKAQPLRRRGDRITRREFMLVAGGAVTTPCVLLAQQKEMPAAPARSVDQKLRHR